ncbi:hypothetical protein D3C76_283660 [compost metagenome]
MKDNGVHCDNGTDWEFWFDGKLISTHATRREANIALSEFDSAPARNLKVPQQGLIVHNKDTGKWNLYFDDFYRGGFSTERAAKRRLQELRGEPVKDKPVDQKPKNGIHFNKESGQYHVWYLGNYQGNFKYKSSAEIRLSQLRKRFR